MATYEAVIKDSKVGKNSNLAIPWPANVTAYYQKSFFDGDLALNRAHQEVPASGIAGIVDTVRNKLLEFALELRREIGTEEPTPENPPPAVVDTQVTNIIFGGTNVFGGNIAGDVGRTVTQVVVAGDFTSLSGALKQIGIPEDRLPALKEALDADQKASLHRDAGPALAQVVENDLADDLGGHALGHLERGRSNRLQGGLDPAVRLGPNPFDVTGAPELVSDQTSS
jgi:hypothetical protein